MKAVVGEYSISVVGPGPRASAHWGLAEEAGVPTMAKVQLNNTWEISAVPYIPAAYLVARHCANLAAAGVGGLQMSWTLGDFREDIASAGAAGYRGVRQVEKLPASWPRL